MKLATLILLTASLFLGASARNPVTGDSFQHLDAAQVAAINRLRLLHRSFPDGKITRLNRLKTVTLGE
jgi:hypothetical protein